MTNDSNAPASQQPYIMSMQQHDEISLSELLISLWQGKWVLTTVTAISILLAIGYLLISPRSAEISLALTPLKDKDFIDYQYLNSVEIEEGAEKQVFFNISKQYLLDLLIQEVNDTDKWINAIINHQLLKQNDFANDNAYQQAVLELAQEFKLVSPKPPNKKGKQQRNFWAIEYKGDYTERELTVIKQVLDTSTERVQNLLAKEFSIKKTLFQQQMQFKLERLTDKINNLIASYDQKTRNRLAFLTEQAEIARTLAIKKNTIEAAQSYSTQNTLVTNIKSDNSFYLRGYQAIEKEIDLLTNRNNKEAYITELIALYNEQRQIKQSRVLARAQTAFTASPIVSTGFNAAHYDIKSTQINPSNKTIVILAGSVIIGIMFGLLVLMMRNAVFQLNNKESE